MPRTPPAVTQASRHGARPKAGAAERKAVPAPRGCSNFKLRQASRLVSRHYDTHITASTGLKTSQYSLLGHIAAMAPVRPGDLARAMSLEPSSLTRNLQPLVAQGWVAIGPGPDARSRLITLTEAGAAKREAARAAWKQAQLSFNARLGEARVLQLHALLDECLRLLAAPDHGDGNSPRDGHDADA